MKLSIFISILFFLFSCQKNISLEPPRLIWFKHEFRNFFSFSYRLETDFSDVYWANNKYVLKMENKTKFNTGNFLVMVSFEENSKLNSFLKSSDATIFINPPTSNDAGNALVKIQDEDFLEKLSNLAHNSSGLSCGNIEVLSSFPLTNTISSIIAPEYQTTLALNDVISLLKLPDSNAIKSSIQTLQDQGSRYYNHPKGLQTPALVKSMMTNAANNGIQGFVINEYQHTNITFIEQNSVIAKIPGTDPNAGTIIIGAHLDSINLENKNNAPGADDDASGVAVLIETIRNIATSKAQFRHDIEFHAYAAEEVGLIGSRDIAEAYNTQNKKIAAMMQLDMVSWSSDPSDTTIYLVENDTSSNLRREVKNLLTAYLDGNYGEVALKAGTSDHKSWNSLGFQAVFPFEHPINHNQALHTENDTLDTINNLPLAKRFTQLTLAFISHFAGLISAENEYKQLTASLQSPDNDIKVAITASTDSGWNVAAATSTESARLELCALNLEIDAKNCSDKLIALEFVVKKNNRSFFANDLSAPIILSDGEHWLIRAYSADNHLIYERAVSLRQKNR